MPHFQMRGTLVWGLNYQIKLCNMIQDMSISVLREKIQELGNALFMSESNALISLPTHVVRVSEVDEEGNIWFIIPKPTQVIESFSKEMPAKLDFFKKGSSFFMKISGVASIVWTANEMKEKNLSNEFTASLMKGNVAVKVKVELSEYIKKAPKATSNPLLHVGAQVYNWLLNPLFSA
jgi:general stress protein 26